MIVTFWVAQLKILYMYYVILLLLIVPLLHFLYFDVEL